MGSARWLGMAAVVLSAALAGADVVVGDRSFRKKAFDGANVIEYPDERGFIPAIVMVNMRPEHATKASLPSPRFPGEQGWYFNQGEKSGIADDWFTVAALVNAGH